MRGMSVTEGFHDFVILRGGLTVFPQLIAEPRAIPDGDEPICSGLVELDALIGGGLTWGTTTLFVGPGRCRQVDGRGPVSLRGGESACQGCRVSVRRAPQDVRGEM